MSRKNANEKNKIIFTFHILVDMFLVCIAYLTVLTYFKYFGNLSISIKNNLLSAALVGVLSLLFFRIYGVFRCGRRTYKEIVFSATLSLVIMNLIMIALDSLFKVFEIDPIIFPYSFLLQILLISFWKFVVYRLYPLFYKPKDVLFFGNGDSAMEIAKRVFAKDKKMFNVMYVLDEDDKDIKSKISKVDTVFISSDIGIDYKNQIIYHSIGMGKKLYLIPELFEISLFNSKMDRFDDVPVLCVEDLHMSMEERVLKRLFDLFVAIIMIIFSSPIMLVTFIAIKMYDRGPALFSQERITAGNKKFDLYKFRTMVVDAEKLTGPVLATDKDKRITPMGAFLRSTRIDELPQLFNVLLGDMSIVGPRPERQHFIDQFKKDYPDYEYRLVAKAGLTGLAQVLGKYSTTTEHKLKFDLIYIRNYSFLLDMKIIFQTVKIMFMKSSSQGVTSGKKKNEPAVGNAR